MPRVVRTRLARADALDIWNFIADDNPDAADKLVRRIDSVIQLLAMQPGLGSSQERYRPGLRCAPVGNYLIFYEPIEEGIRVIRILHGARRWQDLLP